MQGIGLNKIYKLSYIYLAIPLLIFLLGWLKAGYAALCGGLFIGGFLYLYRDIKYRVKWQAKKKFYITAMVLATVWCFLAGIGYFYYQSFDYHFRNAVFRDLINYDWPVFYDKANTPLVYYMGFWLLPAMGGKFFSLGGISAESVFYLANILLFCYAVFGVWLIFMLLGAAIKCENTKQFMFAMSIFIGFSGLDIIGYLFFQINEQPFAYHLDWWAGFMQYSSISTGLFWVFNQFIPAAIMALLIYNEKNIRHFGLLLPMMLFLAPYPTAGIGIFMVAYAIQQLFQAKNKKQFINDEIFSIANIIGVFWILPVVILYFITNTEGMDKLWYIFDFTTPQRLILFMLIEFLGYGIILFGPYRKNLFFITALSTLMFIPFFRVDEQNNFCMRASIPAIVMFSYFAIDFLMTKQNFRKQKGRFWSLILLLIIGGVTPAMEFYRGWHYIGEAKKIALVKDEIVTLNKSFVRMPEFGWDANHQYTAKDYKTDIFWRYLAKLPARNGL